MALEPQGWVLGLGHLVPEGPRDGPRGAEGPSGKRPELGCSEGGLLEPRDQEQVLIFFMFNHSRRSVLLPESPDSLWTPCDVGGQQCAFLRLPSRLPSGAGSGCLPPPLFEPSAVFVTGNRLPFSALWVPIVGVCSSVGLCVIYREVGFAERPAPPEEEQRSICVSTSRGAWGLGGGPRLPLASAAGAGHTHAATGWHSALCSVPAEHRVWLTSQIVEQDGSSTHIRDPFAGHGSDSEGLWSPRKGSKNKSIPRNMKVSGKDCLCWWARAWRGHWRRGPQACRWGNRHDGGTRFPGAAQLHARGTCPGFCQLPLVYLPAQPVTAILAPRRPRPLRAHPGECQVTMAARVRRPT